jgi:hypothetical protein
MRSLSYKKEEKNNYRFKKKKAGPNYNRNKKL